MSEIPRVGLASRLLIPREAIVADYATLLQDHVILTCRYGGQLAARPIVRLRPVTIRGCRTTCGFFRQRPPYALEHDVAAASLSLSPPFSSPAGAVDVTDAVEHDPVARAGHPHRVGNSGVS